MNLSEMFPSKNLKAEDLMGQGDLIANIERIDLEEIGQDRQRKPVVSFAGLEKRLVLNKSNALVLAALFGDDTTAWRGKFVALYATKVPFQGKLVDSIRVRDRIPELPLPNL